MRHLVYILIGLAVAVGIAFVLLRQEAVSPGATITTPTPQGNITVTAPAPGAKVSNPFLVRGEARTFEQNVQWRLSTATGRELAKGFTTATAEDIGQFGPYGFTVSIPEGAPADLILEVFESSARDGAEINTVTVPLRYE